LKEKQKRGLTFGEKVVILKIRVYPRRKARERGFLERPKGHTRGQDTCTFIKKILDFPIGYDE
jgi:hypothetical protein